MFGPLIDRKGAQVNGMSFGILALSVGLLLSAAALDDVLVPFFLVLSTVVSGSGASFYHPTEASLLQSSFRNRRLGRYLGINGLAGSVGRALYPSFLLLAGAVLASNALGVSLFGALGIAFSAVIFFGPRGTQVGTQETKEQTGEAIGAVSSALTRGILLWP